jgi:two-component system, NarL family, nitrate/nitrite response regulator NarL
MIQLRQNQAHKMNAWLERVRPDYALTLREWEIIGLVCHGLSNKEIGRRLDLHEGTVKVHLHNIYTKIGVPNRTALALWGFRATAASISPVSSGAPPSHP